MGHINVRVQKTERRRLHRPAQAEVLLLQRIRQIRHQHLPHLVFRHLVYDQAKGTLAVMLADQHHCSMKERPPQLPAIQKQLSFERFKFL